MKKHSIITKIVFSGILVIVVMLFFGYWLAYHFTQNIEKMERDNLSSLSKKVDDTLFDVNIYLKPDTAYFYKLEELLYEGSIEATYNIFPEDRNYIGLILENQSKARQYDSNIHTVYVALADTEAPYVLVNGGVREKAQLRDTAWRSVAQNMETECYLQWRQVHTSFLNKVNLLTVYRSYESVSYDDGRTVRGYVVTNYYQQHLLNEITALTSDEEKIVLYNSETDELLFVKDSEMPETQIRELLSRDLEDDNRQSGVISVENKKVIYHVQDSAYSSLRYIALKEDTQISKFLSEIYFIFVLVALAVSLAMIVFLIFYYLQKNKYLNGLAQIISATEKNQPMEEDMMQKLADNFKDREMDVAIIAKKILEDNIDIHELKKAVSSEQQLRTEVEMLYGYAQINSHFLLNTLDSIYWKSVENNGIENEETKMVERLCIILKYALDSSNPYISLEEEMECAKDYIAIQSMRKNIHIEMEWKIPDSLKNAKVGKLMLQPILENCIQHGMTSEQQILHLCVEAKLMDNTMLYILVSDDGTGMKISEMTRMNQIFREDQPVRSKHIGLHNVNRRLQLQYGNEYGIVLQPTSNQKGLTVIMRLKYLVMES